MERKLLVVIALFGMCLLAPNMARADWMDDFESYTVGSVIAGQGGWEGWAGDVNAAQELVVGIPVPSMKALEIKGTNADTVQPFSGVNSGTWTLSAWSYIPSGPETGTSYYILMNSYPTALHWASELHFDFVSDPTTTAGTGTVKEYHFQNAQNGFGVAVQNTLDIKRDKWVEIKHVIDLDNDWVTITYGGNLLAADEWKAGGTAELAALDLFAPDNNTVYYDNFSLTPEPSTLALLGIGSFLLRRRRRKA